MEWVMIILVFLGLLFGSYFDQKSMEIPLFISLVPIAAVSVIRICRHDWTVLLCTGLVFVVGCFCMWRTSLGGADVFAICMICLGSGVFGMIWSVLFASTGSIVYLLLAHGIKKRSLKDPYPYLPFLLFGYVLYQVLWYLEA